MEHQGKPEAGAEASPRDVAGTMRANPRWDRVDAEERVRTFAATDWSVMRRIMLHPTRWDLRPRLTELGQQVPTKLILADPSQLVPVAEAARAEAAFGPAFYSAGGDCFRGGHNEFYRAISVLGGIHYAL